jgi:hypothetical protein
MDVNTIMGVEIGMRYGRTSFGCQCKTGSYGNGNSNDFSEIHVSALTMKILLHIS